MDSAYFSQSGERSSQSGTHYGPAGSIVKVQMKNFMCHDNLEVKLNPRINFICGKNGSGKSAIQTAVAVGLGGKALATNRGSSMKDLIKTGKNTCTIIIVLSNQGTTAYRPQDYGSCIQVERSFSQVSSLGYKIKNSAGKIVSTQKRDLEMILAHFNIQTENPVCILHQDVARNFLNSSDPKNKFKFFMKATRLDEISNMYEDIKLKIASTKEILKMKFETVAEAFGDVIEMKNKLKKMEEAKEQERLRDHLNNELVWTRIHEENLEIEKLKQKKELETLTKEKYEKKLKRQEEDNLKGQLRELQDRLQEIDDKVKDAKEKLIPAKQDFMKKKEKWNNHVNELNEAKQGVKLAKRKYDSCLKVIEDLTKNAPEINQKHEDLKREKLECEKKLESYKSAEKSLEHYNQQLKDTVDQLDGILQATTQRCENIQWQKNKRVDHLKQLSHNISSESVYGECISKIVKEINNTSVKRKFVKPVGPIGMHIKVKDPVWAGAVENFLNKGLLSSFCVDNNKDATVLREIFQTICSRYNRRQPAIICSKFLSRVHNTGQSETGNNRYTSLLGALEIDNPVVTNCLIDHQEVETVLLLPTNAEAYNLLDERHKVPRNCKRAFTLTGDLFYPAPNYKSYSSSKPVTHATLLQAKQEDLIKNLKVEIDKLSEDLNSANTERRTIQQQMNDTKNSLTKNEAELKRMKSMKINVERKISEIENTIEQEEGESNVAYFVEESKLLQEQFEKNKDCFEKLASSGENLKTEAEKTKDVFEKLLNIKTECEQEKFTIQEKISDLKSTIEQVSSKVELMRKEVKECQKKISSLEAELTRLAEKIHKDSENVPPVRVRRGTREVMADLKKVNVYLQKLEEQNGGSLEILERKFQDRHEYFNKVNNNLELLQNLVKKERVCLELRDKYKMKLQMFISDSARNNFHMYLTERNFNGNLKFDFNKQTLEIQVKPAAEAERDLRTETSSLSGGEKSFSTVAFIMAMWQEVALPFHFLDEFDVFMDGINRRIVMNLLIDHAKATNQQFVFLTPLDMSNISSSEIVSIHKLEAPRD